MAQVINSEADLTVCWEAGEMREALPALHAARADLLVLDVSRAAEGQELIRQLRAGGAKMPVLATAAELELQTVLTLLRAGAQGYVMKTEGLSAFVAAIRKVLAGQLYVHPSFAEQILTRLAAGAPADPTPSPDRLTTREAEVLRRIGRGASNRQIAQELGLSPKTVESHRLHIKEKLGLASSAELVRFAVMQAEAEPK
jgi:DNA-binding NarL/FixJ family response regulator